MKQRDPGLEWKARKWSAFIVCALMGWFHSEEDAKTWLWCLTPFPATVPRWSETFFGLTAAVAPGPIHRKLMGYMMDRIDREITRAMREVQSS